MRAVANGTTFAHCLMLEDKRPGLVAMTLSTRLIKSRDAEPTSGFHDVRAVRVMALHAVHLAFDYRVVLRQREFRVRLKMALKAGSGIFAGVQNELPFTTTHFDVLAARTVARFASAWSNARVGSELHTGVRAGREDL